MSAEVRLLAVLDTDPGGYNRVVAGALTADEVAGPAAAPRVLAETERSVDAFLEATGGRGAIKVHTSPYYRHTFLDEPYRELWAKAAAAGLDLVLHAHEDRPGGGHYFDDRGHVARVIAETTARLRGAGLPVHAFRSGYCAFSSAIAPILEDNEIFVDLSAAPNIQNRERGVDWRGGPDTAQLLDRDDYRRAPARTLTRVMTVPIGWDGRGAAYAGHYLFNEANSEEGLREVLSAIEERARRRRAPQTVLFLCHTFGFEDRNWARQAKTLLRQLRDTLISVADVRNGLAGGSRGS